MRARWRALIPLLVWLALVLWPFFLGRPDGLSQNAWSYFTVFAAVIVGLILEPIPAAAIGLFGVAFVSVMRYVSDDPAQSLAWALGGFSDSTVWLTFGAFVFSIGYCKTGLGRRIALVLVRRLGGRTLGLGYAIALADLALAPGTPSNTARSGGIIFPVIVNIPALYGSAPGPTARRMGSYIMWTAFAATCVTSSMFVTALAPNAVALAIVKSSAHFEISWFDWFLGFLPIGVVLLALVPLLTYLLYPPLRGAGIPACHQASETDPPDSSDSSEARGADIPACPSDVAVESNRQAGMPAPHEIKSGNEVTAWAATELDKMGKTTRSEWIMVGLVILAVLLWITGSNPSVSLPYLGTNFISPTTVVLLVIALMLATNVVTWDDIISNKCAWNVLVWFATLVTLANGLNSVGFIKWFGERASAPLVGLDPTLAMALLVVLFFAIHYFFASVSAHTIAVLPVILAAGLAIPNMPAVPLSLLLVYSIGLMGVITPYATGPAAIYYGSGYIARAEFWKLGLIFGAVFVAVLLGMGIPYLEWLQAGLR